MKQSTPKIESIHPKNSQIQAQAQSQLDKEYKCGLCFNSFSKQDLLLNHLRTQHWSKNKKNDTNLVSFAREIQAREPKRNSVNIIKEEDILKNEEEMSKIMIFSTRTIEEKREAELKMVKIEEEGNVVKKLKRVEGPILILPSLKKLSQKGSKDFKEKALLSPDGVTRASTKKEKKSLDSFEGSPMKVTDRAKRSLRRTTPSSPLPGKKVKIFFYKKISFFFAFEF